MAERTPKQPPEELELGPLRSRVDCAMAVLGVRALRALVALAEAFVAVEELLAPHASPGAGVDASPAADADATSAPR